MTRDPDIFIGSDGHHFLGWIALLDIARRVGHEGLNFLGPSFFLTEAFVVQLRLDLGSDFLVSPGLLVLLLFVFIC